MKYMFIYVDFHWFSMKSFTGVIFFVCYIAVSTSLAQTRIKSIKHIGSHSYPQTRIEFTERGDTLSFTGVPVGGKEIDLLRNKFDGQGRIIEKFRRGGILQGIDTIVSYSYDISGKLNKKYEKILFNWTQVSRQEKSIIDGKLHGYTKLLTTHYYPNGKVKEFLHEEKSEESDRTFFAKKVIYDEKGKLTFEDSLHTFITFLSPDKKGYQYIVIKDTNTFHLDNRDYKFYRKLYMNSDSVLYKTVEYRDNDSLVCKFAVKKGTLNQEYVSDSRFKGAKKFDDIKTYYYGYDLMQIELDRIYDVRNLEYEGHYELVDGFGRVAMEVISTRGNESEGEISGIDMKNQIFPLRRVYYDFYGNAVRDEFYFNPCDMIYGSEEQCITKNSKIARLYEYTYDVNGVILKEVVKGAIIIGIPFNADYPDILSNIKVIDSNLVLIKSNEFTANRKITRFGSYSFSKESLSYKTYDQLYKNGTFIKVYDGIKSFGVFVNTGKRISLKVINEKSGLEAQKLFHYDSKDSLIRIETIFNGKGLDDPNEITGTVTFGEEAFLKRDLARTTHYYEYFEPGHSGKLIVGDTYNSSGDTKQFRILNGDTLLSIQICLRYDDHHRLVSKYSRTWERLTYNKDKKLPQERLETELIQYCYAPYNEQIEILRVKNGDTLTKGTVRYIGKQIGEVSLDKKPYGPKGKYENKRFIYEYDIVGNLTKKSVYKENKLSVAEKYEYEYFEK